ncbi:MAG: class I SAM-dependent methyltransferase [Clostridiales bacterium]|nr:methyltransferase domain-containing protein [Eubacteriales bacterium]MDD4710746.1 methyltransferase domain-containing protein [Eubacteriales bacterium]NLO14587.1 class I SAM-dependent methyltransferase [Clostridiales bacterium]
MYTELSALLQKPRLYEKTTSKFWNDPHISAGMLKTHLDPNTDAASRKPETIRRSAHWISSLIPCGAALMDIGCGPGLYTRQFAECGLRVTGMDFSERSIAWAREHDAASTYLVQDYLEMDFDSAFGIITLVWCDYGALVPEDRTNLLRRVRKALKPGGLFLFDVFTPRRYDTFEEETSWEICEDGGFWSPRPYLCLSVKYCYENHIGVWRYVIVEDDTSRSYNIWDTGFTREDLSEELAVQGFSPLAFYSDAEGGAYDAASSTLCAIMKKTER